MIRAVEVQFKSLQFGLALMVCRRVSERPSRRRFWQPWAAALDRTARQVPELKGISIRSRQARLLELTGQFRELVAFRYSTRNAVDPGRRRAQILRQALRPWVHIKVDLIRDRGALARMVELGGLENVCRLQIRDATEERQVVCLSASDLDGIELAPESLVEVLHLQSETDPTIRQDEKTTFLVPR